VSRKRKQTITVVARLVSCAVAMAGALLVMCACAQLGRPTVPATNAPFSAQTAIPDAIPLPAPSDMPVPGPLPATELASEPVTHNLTDNGSGATGENDAHGVPSAADMAIQVPGQVQLVPGQTTIYTLTLHNQGPDPASGIVVTHLLPKGVLPVWTQPGQPVCGRQEGSVGCDVGDLRVGDAATLTLDVSVAGTETTITGTQLAGATLDLSAGTCAIGQDLAQPQVTCHLTNLQAGAEAQVRVGMDVDAGLTGSLVHTATVTANEADADRSNNRATATMTAGRGKGPGEVSALPASTDLVVQADGPSSVIAGQPFTYTYTITNRGGLDATGVRFEDAVPPDMELVAYAPGLPRCEQQGDALTCTLHDLDSLETVTVTLVITGHGGAPMLMGLDPLMPGWPICSVIKERTFLHIVHCELGALKPGQAARVRLVLLPVGVQERLTINTVSVTAIEADLNPLDNTITTTVAVQSSEDNED
jgi:uncharacterized repeat protein (TIGR01451 family)